ncbi:uncharacterized protein A1O9_08019 [Exophiala aquamarina CBS 119918]|uniref:G-patch domain-containing protein n=1 Tax=Exophiala aquamarina CBS 119918 TaxID=1182545 RepID=A0A072PAY6_9EURO|nr:uncharacterized protein A1O9_08019 [Exophiala aquamarina CBS 119918]KEF56438.1 hypothetical protein A1O9_08019 [Exophiala aquamarina CBS 119918]
MANNTPPAQPPPRGGLSLYANLLDPKNATAPGTISSAPVSYNRSPEQDEAVKKQQALAASLRFQPTKRPQITAQKAKAKAIASKFAPPPASSSSITPATSSITATTTSTITVAPKNTLADWIATASDDEDVNNFYQGEKRQRGGRKKRKKNKEAAVLTQHWDDIYDPSRPNNYDEYKHSEEKVHEIRDWKDLLYRHKMRRRDSSASASDDYRPPVNKQFAPPMSFAPPPDINDDDDVPPPPLDQPPPPPADIPDDPTGEDAYMRRLRMSQMQSTNSPPPPPPTGQISREPVRYNLPAAPEEIPSSEAELEEKLAEPEAGGDTSTDAPRSNRPGQAGFAQRLMSKYGWSKGQGLGAQGTGIINPLYAKADKRKKKSDAEGGGFATPTTMGKILGGNKSKSAQAEEEGKFGAMSEVVRLDGMLDGLDLDEELQRGQGGIMQEIGEECGEKYGSVQRVYIHRAESEDEQALVFVAFVSQLSALRAVNALEGRIFNGNQINARFWPKEKFDAGVYD